MITPTCICRGQTANSRLLAGRTHNPPIEVCVCRLGALSRFTAWMDQVASQGDEPCHGISRGRRPHSRPPAGILARPGGNSGGTFVRGSVMAGRGGQGRFCPLTSQNGIGDDRQRSTATVCAGLQNWWTALRVIGGFDSRPPPQPGQA